MYDELIKRLWECVSGECWNCSQHKDSYDGQRTCADNLMKQAADAIEELSKPRWISVEEALPEDGEEVLCYYEYFRYGRFNCMYKTVDRGYFFNGHFEGEPTNGRKAKVLYWMPLPEPPKEE